ncbi:MAG: response regulator [Pseudomonadota bacterium]
MEQKEKIQVIRSALLIEDDQICQRIIIVNLSRLGFVVDAANDATTAIHKLKEISYNLIVTDLRLPDKSGDEVIKAARLSVLNQAAPLIVGSAQLNQNDFKTYLDLGADAVLTKPYSYEKLAETIKNCYLTPGYQRKFFYQIKNSLKKFQQNLEDFLKTKQFQALSTDSQNFLRQSLHIIKEFQHIAARLRSFCWIKEHQQLISNLQIFINHSIAALKEYQQWPKIDKNHS